MAAARWSPGPQPRPDIGIFVTGNNFESQLERSLPRGILIHDMAVQCSVVLLVSAVCAVTWQEYIRTLILPLNINYIYI